MAQAPLSDRDILDKLGDETLNDELGVTEHQAKKWRQRGIPWKDRAKIARLAQSRRIKLPANFIEERAA